MNRLVSSPLERLGRRIRLGMVGGGLDSVIGATHRLALRVDGMYEHVAGAMSIDPDIARATGHADLLAHDRIYTDYREMAERESARPDSIDVVVIATPPDLHLSIAREFLRHGINVICEKPATATAAEARQLATAVDETGLLFMLTHCYSGYPIVREARAMVREGVLGPIRIADAELATGDPGVARAPDDPTKAHWNQRSDTMGRAVILGEIGSHAHHLIRYLVGADVTRVTAQLETLAEGREVYDNAYLSIELDNGAVGRLWSSFVAAGNEHGLAFRVYGVQGSLVWHQEEPEVMWHKRLGRSSVRLSRGLDELSSESLAATRLRPGHPEGYILAFANLYRDFGNALIARALAEDPLPFLKELPGVDDAIATLELIEAAQRSHDAGGQPVAVGLMA
jgi:predicted dehydrogenase